LTYEGLDDGTPFIIEEHRCIFHDGASTVADQDRLLLQVGEVCTLGSSEDTRYDISVLEESILDPNVKTTN
jgi:hypothetical protein